MRRWKDEEDDEELKNSTALLIVGSLIGYGIAIIVGVVVGCWVFYTIGAGIFNYIRLERYGEKTKAVVTKSIEYSDNTKPAVNYEFVVNGKRYIQKAKEVSVKKAVGDSITIVYVPDNPDVNDIEE